MCAHENWYMKKVQGGFESLQCVFFLVASVYRLGDFWVKGKNMNCAHENLYIEKKFPGRLRVIAEVDQNARRAGPNVDKQEKHTKC
jgi:hypothetical protein